MIINNNYIYMVEKALSLIVHANEPKTEYEQCARPLFSYT